MFIGIKTSKNNLTKPPTPDVFILISKSYCVLLRLFRIICLCLFPVTADFWSDDWLEETKYGESFATLPEHVQRARVWTESVWQWRASYSTKGWKTLQVSLPWGFHRQFVFHRDLNYATLTYPCNVYSSFEVPVKTISWEKRLFHL